MPRPPPRKSVLSENTIRAYRCDWNHFVRWCRARRLSALPAEAETVRLYVASLASTHRIASIVRRVDGITRRQRDYGAWTPAARKSTAVRNQLRAIRRDQSRRPAAQRSLTIEELRKMMSRLPATPLGLRNRALLLLWFAGSFRRFELAAIDFDDVMDKGDGLAILMRSRTDQDGESRKIEIACTSDPSVCPLLAFRRWIAAAKITEGPVFRRFSNKTTMSARGITGRMVAFVVKKAAERANFPPPRSPAPRGPRGGAGAAEPRGGERRVGK